MMVNGYASEWLHHFVHKLKSRFVKLKRKIQLFLPIILLFCHCTDTQTLEADLTSIYSFIYINNITRNEHTQIQYTKIN